jgi:TrkA domain protein
MATIREVDLPGIGRKFELITRSGEKLVVVIHDDGRRELYTFPTPDAEESTGLVTLDDREARQVAGIVGGLSYTPKALESIELALSDLVIEWFRVEPTSPIVGRSIGDLRIRKATGASIIAIIAPDRHKTINPGPEAVVQAGATLVVVGERRMVQAFEQLVRQGGP